MEVEKKHTALGDLKCEENLTKKESHVQHQQQQQQQIPFRHVSHQLERRQQRKQQNVRPLSQQRIKQEEPHGERQRQINKFKYQTEVKQEESGEAEDQRRKPKCHPQVQRNGQSGAQKNEERRELLPTQQTHHSQLGSAQLLPSGLSGDSNHVVGNYQHGNSESCRNESGLSLPDSNGGIHRLSPVSNNWHSPSLHLLVNANTDTVLPVNSCGGSNSYLGTPGGDTFTAMSSAMDLTRRRNHCAAGCVHRRRSRSDFSIASLLSDTTEDRRCPCSNLCSPNELLQPGHDERLGWLNCSRYKPPKLIRNKKEGVSVRRRLGRNPRIPFSAQQVALLEHKFRKKQYLSSSDVSELATLLCLSHTRVKIWFQNRRARERRDNDCQRTNLGTSRASANQNSPYSGSQLNAADSQSECSVSHLITSNSQSAASSRAHISTAGKLSAFRPVPSSYDLLSKQAHNAPTQSRNSSAHCVIFTESSSVLSPHIHLSPDVCVASSLE